MRTMLTEPIDLFKFLDPFDPSNKAHFNAKLPKWDFALKPEYVGYPVTIVYGDGQLTAIISSIEVSSIVTSGDHPGAVIMIRLSGEQEVWHDQRSFKINCIKICLEGLPGMNGFKIHKAVMFGEIKKSTDTPSVTDSIPVTLWKV